MFKKILSLLLCLSLCLCFTACNKPKEPATDTQAPSEDSAASNSEQSDLISNPLTGMLDFNPEKSKVRPVAIMIDNDSVAQKNAQSGVQAADVVFETEVEGGITRLMAVFADISKAPQIGDVRSARVVFVEIATGFNAIYAHHGQDETYCVPRMRELGTDDFSVGEGNCGWRHTYGNATNWQNLYTNGEKFWKSLNDSKWKTTQDEFSAWQTFTDEALTLTGGVANKATVSFSGSSTSYFEYDQTTGKYIKTSGHTTNKDIITGEAYEFKNIFVLKTPMGYYSDGKHRKIDLNSGTGYYIVNGTYEKINWKKGSASNNFTFTKADGTPLTVQAGNSWVCIAKTDAGVTFN